MILTVCLLLAGITCSAQYHPQYSQYVFNGLALNPAYAGSKEALNLAVLCRSSQWGNSIAGAPATYTLSGDFPLQNPQLSLGLLLFDDLISIFRQTGAYFAYAFRVKTGDKGKLSFGLQAGFDFHREDGSMVFLIDEDDPSFPKEKFSMFMPNAGVGSYYYTSNFFVGLSLPQIISYSSRKENTTNNYDYPPYKCKPIFSNFMLYGGTTFPLNQNFKIKPSALLQYPGKKLLLDLNCNFAMFNDMFEIGLSWRNNTTLVAMTQFRYHSLSFGYAYDFSIGIPSAINTSHEIMVRYDLKIMVNAINPLQLR